MVRKLFDPRSGFIFMKVGLHAQEPIEEIVARKRRELDRAGMIFWGYGGNTCHPRSMVQPFAREIAAHDGRVFLIMQKMDSKHFAAPDIARQYSEDGIDWRNIPSGIEVRGSRYALVLGSLEEEQFDVDLRDMRVAVGPSRGKRGDDYIAGRVDKACFEFDPCEATAKDDPSPIKRLDLVAGLATPYAVFLR